MLLGLRGGVRGVCASKPHYSIFTSLPPLAHTRTSTPFTHTRIQSATKYRLRVKARVREKGRKAGEGVMAWRARRDTPFTSRICLCFRHLRALCARSSVPARLEPRAIELQHT